MGSLWPGGPAPEDEAWVRTVLLPAEVVLWERMSAPDRRHAVGVARRLEPSERPVLAAALLHDVGKVAAGLGTYGRVVATLSARAAGRWSAEAAGRSSAEAWSQRRGFTRRVGLYLRHDELGADMLALAGSDPLTVAWAREHHLPADEWTVPPDLGHRLKAADDD